MAKFTTEDLAGTKRPKIKEKDVTGIRKKVRYFYKWLVVMILLIGGTIGATGCLNAEQKAAMAESKAAVQQAELILASLDDQIRDVFQMIKEGKIDKEKGLALIDAFKANKKPFEETKDRNIAAFKRMQDADVPWYGYLIYGLNIAAGIGGTFLGVKKIGSAATVVNEVVGAFAATSRGLDAGFAAASDEAGMVIREKMGETIDAHKLRDTVETLHSMASAGKI